MRTCVGCRARAPRSELLRVVAVGGVVIIDVRTAHAGRGAWLHHRIECAQAAITRRVFASRLRADTPLDTQALIDYFQGMAQ